MHFNPFPKDRIEPGKQPVAPGSPFEWRLVEMAARP